MIIYSPFWETLKKSGETTYSLIKNHGISSSRIDRLRNNKPISTTTMNDLCKVLNCNVSDIAVYIPDEDEK